MANLKLDLLNKLRNDKYYDEIELVRLAQEPNMNYKEKIELMQAKLNGIALLNAEMGLVEQYFQEPTAQQMPPEHVPPQGAPPVQAQPSGRIHQGQTHGE